MTDAPTVAVPDSPILLEHIALLETRVCSHAELAPSLLGLPDVLIERCFGFLSLADAVATAALLCHRLRRRRTEIVQHIVRKFPRDRIEWWVQRCARTGAGGGSVMS